MPNIDEVFDMGIRDGIGRRRSCFENLAQVHHRLNVVQPQSRQEGEHVLFLHQREQRTENIRMVLVDP